MLLSAHGPLVFDEDLIKLESAIAGARRATISQVSHLVFVHRHETACARGDLSQDRVESIPLTVVATFRLIA